MAELLAEATRTPIGELSPALSAAYTRSLKAIVTLIWPYSSSNSLLKVLLAEPDFRLRRTRGQVRVLFTGSSARTVFEAGIGSGDEVVLSLVGAEWVKDGFGAQTNTPGRGIEWDLKYSERLVLQIVQSETKKISLLDIDHPAPKPETESNNAFPASEPEIATFDPIATSTERHKLVRTESSELPSPAFIKRARVSYGSLLESDYDIFAEDDGTIQGKGRKRTRFSRESNRWRYSSHSTSPSLEGLDADTLEANFSEPEEKSKPSMTDEGSQTLDFEEINTIDQSRSFAAHASDLEQSTPLQNRAPEWEANTQVIWSGHNEAVVDKMLPPPKPNLVLEVGAPTSNNDHQAIEDGATVTPISPRLNPVSSDALSLVSPLVSSALGVFSGQQLESVIDLEEEQGWFEHSNPNDKETVTLEDLTEADDIYGLSPTAPDGQQDAHTLSSVRLSVTHHEGTQIIPFEEYRDPTDQYGHWQNEIASQEPVSRLMSPYGPESFLKETYPEPDIMETQQHHLQAGPYYDYDRIHSPTSSGSHNRQKQTSHGGFAMSRSQSARSEVVDLTEASDEDTETHEVSADVRFPNQRAQIIPGEHQGLFVGKSDEESDAEDDGYNIGSSMEEQVNTLQYREDPFLDEIEKGDEVNEFSDNMRTPGKQQAAQQLYHKNLLLDESGEEEDDDESDDEEENSVEEFDEDELQGDYPQDFRSVGEDQSEDQSEDHFDEDEEDILYDEDVSEGEDAATAIKTLQGEPEVIDLLSSDEEDVDEIAGIRSGEVENENVPEESLYHSQDGSASEMDVEGKVEHEEVEDEEVKEDEVEDDEVSGDERFRNATEATQTEGEVDRSPSIEAVTEDANISNMMLEIVQQPLSGVLTNKHDQHHYIRNRIGTNSTSKRSHDESGGMDGATDDPTATEELYPTLPLNDVAAERARSSVSLHEISPKPLNKAYDNKEHINENHTNMDPVTRESHTQESTSDKSMNQLSDTQEPSSQIKIILEDNSSHRKENRQLPTPEATQLTGYFAPEISFRAPDLVEPSTPSKPTVTSINVNSASDAKKSRSASVDSFSSPDVYDASAELALSVLDSPSKNSRKEPHLSNAALRVKLTRPLQTNLGSFTPLKLVRFHLEQKVDVIALVTTQPPEPQRAKNGPRDYHIRFNIIDASVSPTGVMGTQIFRPYKSALPIVKPGDGILLRDFAVKAETRAGFALRSDEGSSWVVFKENNEEKASGPPVEYEDGEREHVARLKTWFRGLDIRSKERLDRANGDTGANGDKRR